MTKRLIEMANEYCETGSYAIMRQIEEFCNTSNLFFAEDEDFIQIEDEVFRFKF